MEFEEEVLLDQFDGDDTDEKEAVPGVPEEEPEVTPGFEEEDDEDEEGEI